MTLRINPTKIITAMIVAVLVAIVISNLVAVSEFGTVGQLISQVVVPVLAGLGAASKVGNKKGGTQ